MTFEEIATRAWGPVATLIVGILGGGGLWKWLGAREAARPDVIEASGEMMQKAFAHIHAEMKRMEEREAAAIARIQSEREIHLAEMMAAREMRHKLASRVMALESYAYKLLDHLRQCLAIIADADLAAPQPPKGITIDELMAGPVAVYQPGASTMPRPVTDRDEGR